ncbi:MAG: hypothetical protein K2P76_02445 [Lachnospiraceae bacterium]|nr:hypothetical protein [Lachnospiraceae bacterium]
MKKVEGSFTVEITLLAPLIFLAMFLPVFKAFDFYKDVEQDSLYVWQENFVPEESIRKIQFAEEIWEEIR